MLLTTVFVSLCWLIQADAFPAAGDFEAWATTYGKQYASDLARDVARANFLQNAARIAAHNALELPYTLGHTRFSDLTPEQYVLTQLTPLRALKGAVRAGEVNSSYVLKAGDLDWVAKGAVTPVKDQANCGSCWAFSTTGAIEGAYQIASGKLVSLSEQNLVSCSFNGNQGCGGGEPDAAMCWVYHNRGLCTEHDYNYTSGNGQDGKKCWTNCTPAVSVKGYHAVAKGDEAALMSALEKGPVSIGVDASSHAFMLYNNGIITAKTCGNQIDHGDHSCPDPYSQ